MSGRRRLRWRREPWGDFHLGVWVSDRAVTLHLGRHALTWDRRPWLAP